MSIDPEDYTNKTVLICPPWGGGGGGLSPVAFIKIKKVSVAALDGSAAAQMKPRSLARSGAGSGQGPVGVRDRAAHLRRDRAHRPLLAQVCRAPIPIL
jgi:hypothetical protein